MKVHPELVIQQAQDQLQALKADGLTWAQVAEAIGLAARDRAAVHQVATKGSLQKRVLKALGLPFEFQQVLVYDKAAARENIFFRLEGELHYTTMDGQAAVADLGLRAARLGIKNRKQVSAAELHRLFRGTKVLEGMEKNAT